MNGKNEKKFDNNYFYIGLTAFLVVAACVIFFFVLFRMNGILSYLKKLLYVVQPVIIGLVIAYLVNPINNYLQGLLKKLTGKYFKKKDVSEKVSKATSVLLSLAIFILALILIFYMIIPQFVESISSLVKVLPGQMDSFINKVSAELDKNKDVQNLILSIYEYEKKWLQTDFTSYVNSVAAYFATGVLNVVNFLKNFAIGLIFALYILYNKRLLLRQFRKLLYSCIKNSVVEHILVTVKKANKIFSGFIFGKLLDSFIIGVLCFIGVSILKIPYTMLVAVVVGVTNIIPVFGPYLGGIPCAALILLTSPIKGLYFIIFIILLQALDGNFIGPKILGNSTGLSAFWVVFAIVLGGGMFGIPGMLIGVPVFAVIYYLTRTFVNYRIGKKELPLNTEYYDSTVYNKIKHENSLQVKIPIDDNNQSE